jgi:hypothetical protein
VIDVVASTAAPITATATATWKGTEVAQSCRNFSHMGRS